MRFEKRATLLKFKPGLTIGGFIYVVNAEMTSLKATVPAWFDADTSKDLGLS